MCDTLSLQNVSLGYSGTPVLRDVSLTVHSGTFLALVGPNGCGKTTLLKAMARQLPPLGGRIDLEKQPLAAFDRKAFARRVAYMPQTRSLPEISVEGLVSHGRFPYLGLSRRMTAADRAAVQTAMRQAGVADWAAREVRSLSGGQRQRVYLAMALAQGSRVLLLDEPTTFLDIAAQFELLELLRRLAGEGYAVVAVLHDLAQALQYSTEMAVLANGTLAAFDAPEALFASGLLDTVFGACVRRTAQGHYYVCSRPAAQNGPAQED